MDKVQSKMATAADSAAKRGILLLKRTSDLLRQNPPDLRGALAECNAAVQEDPSNPVSQRVTS